VRRIADARAAANFSELVFRCSSSVSSVAARAAAFFWSFADVAAVADGTARIRARRSSAPPSSGQHVIDISRVQKGASIIVIAIRNFGDCGAMPSGA